MPNSGFLKQKEQERGNILFLRPLNFHRNKHLPEGKRCLERCSADLNVANSLAQQALQWLRRKMLFWESIWRSGVGPQWQIGRYHESRAYGHQEFKGPCVEKERSLNHWGKECVRRAKRYSIPCNIGEWHLGVHLQAYLSIWRYSDAKKSEFLLYW